MTEKKCAYCAMMIPNEANICPHCRKPQGVSLGVKFFLGVLFIIVVAYTLNIISKENKARSVGSMRGASVAIPSREMPSDEQIYREFERCMNNAMAHAKAGRTLDARDASVICMSSLDKFGKEQWKKAVDLYFSTH
ncbi:MAG: hypothetical protein M0Z79_11095 [Nitrospiraceae bacterium]|nr:hypothetical protein [Nitrospiraceae bacterium]